MTKPQISNFPCKLHDMLDFATENGYSNVVSWSKDGKSFIIHDPNKLVPILKRHFRQTKYKSLLRQLQGYGFSRVTSGERKGQVSHPLFVRGQRSKSLNMKRKQPKKASTSTTRSPEKLRNEKELNDDNSSSSASEIVPLKSRSNEPIVDSAVSSNRAPNAKGSNIDESDIKELELNFCSARSRAKEVPAADKAPGNKNKHLQLQRPSVMDTLRVEIGCTISRSDCGIKDATMALTKSSSSLKRSGTKRHQSIHGSASAPNLDSSRASKRQRSREKVQRNHSCFAGIQSMHNASFPLPEIELQNDLLQDDAILSEEKTQFQDDEEKSFHFEKNYLSEPQFRHSQSISSSFGTFDLDISLTTTTKLSRVDGKEVEKCTTETISNNFFPPDAINPTPILSPKHGSTKSSTATTSFLALDGNNDDLLADHTPSIGFGTSDQTPSELKSVDDVESLDNLSDFSDDIDEGILQAFEPTFESDCEEDEDIDDFTKALEKISYNGEADCDLERRVPELRTKQLGTTSQTQAQVLMTRPCTNDDIVQRQQVYQQQIRLQQMRLHHMQQEQMQRQRIQLMMMQQGMARTAPPQFSVPHRLPIAQPQLRQQSFPTFMNTPYQSMANPTPFHGQTPVNR